MSISHDESAVFCPLNATLNLLNQRWTLHIMISLMPDKKRFNEIARDTGINPRTLRERLRYLEEEQMITRNVISQMPPNVEYALTPKGAELGQLLESLATWGRLWMHPTGEELIGAY